MVRVRGSVGQANYSDAFVERLAVHAKECDRCLDVPGVQTKYRHEAGAYEGWACEYTRFTHSPGVEGLSSTSLDIEEGDWKRWV
jgi:hypothetical protein